MTPTQIEIGYRMGGSVIPDTLLGSLIIIQMSKAGFVPLTLTATYTKAESQTSWAILSIRFVSLVSLSQRSESVTSSLMGVSAPASLTGSGENTQGLTNTKAHAHFSFKKEADNDGSFYQVPMLGGSNE
jgi:hypothetical protein